MLLSGCYSFLGQLLELCPGCLQIPHHLLEDVDGVALTGWGVTLEGSVISLRSSFGEQALLEGFGVVGKGHVISISSVGQNSLIFSWRYQLCSGVRPLGCTTDGSSLGFGVQLLFSRLTPTSLVSECSLITTLPGFCISKTKWCIFLMPETFLNLAAKRWSNHTFLLMFCYLL